MLGGRAVGGFKDGGGVADVGARRHAQSAHHSRCRIGDVVAVEVEGGEHRILLGPGLDLLEDAVGDAVIDQHHRLPLAIAVAFADAIDHGLHLGADPFFFLGGEAVVARLDQAGVVLAAEGVVPLQVVEDPAFPLGDAHVAEFAGGQLVAPVAEGALGEFHDVALVHQGHVALVALEAQGVLDGFADVALAAVLAHGFDANPGARRDLALAELAVGRDHHRVEVLDQIEADLVIGLPLDPHVDVFGVFPVDDHIEVLGPLVGAGGAGVVAAGPHAAIEIEDLAQGHIQGANPAANRGGEGTLDGHAVGADRLEGVFGQVLVGAVELAGLIAGKHLEPLDPALAAVGLGHGRIEHPLGGGPDVDAGAVAADEGNDRIVRHHRMAVLKADGRAAGGGGELVVLPSGTGDHGCCIGDRVSLGFTHQGFCSRRTA